MFRVPRMLLPRDRRMLLPRDRRMVRARLHTLLDRSEKERENGERAN